MAERDIALERSEHVVPCSEQRSAREAPLA
jgi:hypothetical protein